MKKLILAILILSSLNLKAQYTGGKGSGYAQAICSQALSILTNNEINVIKIYPNPAPKGKLVSLSVPETLLNSTFMLIITSLSGQEIYKANITSSKYYIDPSNLKPGIYIYKVSAQNCFKSGLLTIE
jgi:hypothetical protein